MTGVQILGWAVLILLLMSSTFCLVWGCWTVFKNADNAAFCRGLLAALAIVCGTPAAKFFIGFFIGLIWG